MNHAAELLGYATTYRRFQVALSSNVTVCGISDDVWNVTLNTVLRLLLTRADKCRFYWRSAKRVVPVPVPPFVTERASRLEIDIRRASLDDWLAFWKWAIEGTQDTGGNLVLTLKSRDFPATEISEHAWDPGVSASFASIFSAAVASFTRRETASADKVCCIVSRDACRPDLTVVAQPGVIEDLFLIFLKRSPFHHKPEGDFVRDALVAWEAERARRGLGDPET